MAETVVSLRQQEDQPDGDDLPEGELAQPQVVGGEAAIQQLRDPQALQASPENREVIDALDADQLRCCRAHPIVSIPP